MSNFLLATPALSDEATIAVVGSEASDLPARHLQEQRRSKKWRATDTANAYLEIDLGAAVSWNLVALLGSNAISTTQWRVRADADQADLTAPSVQYDSTLRSFWPGSGADLSNWETTPSLLWLSGDIAQNLQWIRIDVSHTGDYFEASRLFIANAWQASVNMLVGSSFPYPVELVQRSFTQGDETIAARRRRKVRTELTFQSITESEVKATVWDLGIDRGASSDVLYVFDPDAASYVAQGMVWGLMDQLQPIRNVATGLWEMTFQIEEL